jgi:hypothetical protein
MAAGIVVILSGVDIHPVAFRALQARVSFTIFDMAFVALVLTGSVVSLGYRDEGQYSLRELVAAGLIVSVIGIVFLFVHGFVRLLAYRWCGLPVFSLSIEFTGDNPDVPRYRSNPAIELCVGLVGIGTCLSIAAATLLVHYTWADEPGSLFGVATMALVLISLIFALVQMTPGISQDGGQIVRGAMWYFSGNPLKGAWVTGRLGQLLSAIVVLCLGLSLVVSFDAILGVGVVLVAVQLALLARQGTRTVGWQYVSVNHEIELQQVVERPCRLIAADDPVEERFALLRRRPWASYLVIDPDGEARGIVSASSLRRLPASMRRRAVISDVMTPIDRVNSFPGETSASAVWETLRQFGGTVAVITSNGLPTDIVTIDQLRRRLVILSHTHNGDVVPTGA